MSKWMIFVLDDFPLDDGGWDCMNAEFDGVTYDSFDEALDVVHKAQDDPRYAGDIFYIVDKEV